MSDIALTLPERSALLALMVMVREASNADINDLFRFRIKKKVRERLTELELVTCRQGSRNAWLHELTDLGWRRGRAELSAEPPPNKHPGYRAVYGVLNGFARYMTRCGIEIADVFPCKGDSRAGTSDTDTPEVFPIDLEQRIREVYAALADRPSAWVGLLEMRAKLADVAPDDLDETLTRMARRPDIDFIPEANQRTLTDADRDAALRLGGEDKHLLSIEVSDRVG